MTVGYERHCHTLEHQGNAGRVEDADPIAREACGRFMPVHELFAEMVAKMKAIDEGGSTLLDNSMILYTSYMADGGHGTQDYPTAGRQGRWHAEAGPTPRLCRETPMSNLYVEMLDRMGARAPVSATAPRRKTRRMTGGYRGWCKAITCLRFADVQT